MGYNAQQWQKSSLYSLHPWVLGLPIVTEMSTNDDRGEVLLFIWLGFNVWTGVVCWLAVVSDWNSIHPKINNADVLRIYNINIGPLFFTLNTADIGSLIRSLGFNNNSYTDDNQVYSSFYPEECIVLQDKSSITSRLLATGWQAQADARPDEVSVFGVLHQDGSIWSIGQCSP